MSHNRLANWDARLPRDIIYELNTLSKKSEVLADLAHMGFVAELDELIEQIKDCENEQDKQAAQKALDDFLKEKAKKDQAKKDQAKKDQAKKDQAKKDQAQPNSENTSDKQPDGDDGDSEKDGEDGDGDGEEEDGEAGEGTDGEDGDGEADEGADGDDGDGEDGEGTDGDDGDGEDGEGADGDDGDGEDGESADGDDGDGDGEGADGDDSDDEDSEDGDGTNRNNQNNKPSKNGTSTPNRFEFSENGEIDVDAAIEMMEKLLENLQNAPENQEETESELSEFQQRLLNNAMRNSPQIQEMLEKMALLQNLDKNETITNLPENFKKLLWNVPKMLGVFKDVTDGFKRGRPSATFGEKIVQTRGKLVRPRTSKIAQDFELYPSLALLDIAKNNTHVYRAEQKSGEGEFVLAVDLSGSMRSYFDRQCTFTFFDLAKTIAMCLYSIKKTHIVGWGDKSVVFSSQDQFAQADATQGKTLISSCYHAINQLFENKRIAHKLQKGTDVVILTDGLPHDHDEAMSIAIKKLVGENKGIVWLFDLVGEETSAYRDQTIPTQWSAISDRYVRIHTLDDIKNIEYAMRKSMRKLK